VHFENEKVLGIIENLNTIVSQKIDDFDFLFLQAELEGLRQCHIRDAVAVVRYFSFLEENLNNCDSPPISEYDGATKLEEFREYGENFFSLSFDTISSCGPNGAIIHYKVTSFGYLIFGVDANCLF